MKDLDGPGVSIPIPQPYDWPAIWRHIAMRAIPGVEVTAGDRYLRAVEIGGEIGLLSVCRVGDDGLEVSTTLPARMLPEIEARVRRLYDLDSDTTAIEAHLAGDSMLAPLVAARPGLRLAGGWDGFELALRTVLGQQVTVVAAMGLAAKLARAYGDSLPAHLQRFGLTQAFPRPERLAGVEPQGLGMPGARARTLGAVAQAVLDDPDLLDPLQPADLAIARLRAIKGVGEWTAQYIAMRALRDADAFPAGDVALQKAVGLLEGGERPSAKGLLVRAERWRPHRAHAAQHLWSYVSVQA